MSNFLKLKHVHVNKDRIKASFDITVKKLTNLNEYNGKPVTLSWKRGKRPANAGTLKEAVVDHGEAVWDEKIVVQVTLFKEVGIDKFDEKSLHLQINQGSKGIGKLRIDLGEIAKSDGSSVLEFPLGKKQNSPTLHILVHARWLKLNDRLLVRLEDGQGADHHGNGTGNGQPKPMLEIDGQPYNLRTDDALTDPSVDTTSGSWEEEDEAKDHYGHNEHDPFTSVSVFEAETRKVQDELETIRKQLRLVEGQSSERAKTIELQEKEILSLRNKVVENEELVQRAMNMEGFMDQQIALLKQEHEEAIRQLKQQHSKELEAEVDRHREELETALTRAQLCLLSPSLPHNDAKEVEALKAERETLTKERDALTKERDRLKHDVNLVTRELEKSANQLVDYSAQILERDEKITRLKDETKSLSISLSSVTKENQTLKKQLADGGSSSSARDGEDDTITSESASETRRVVPRKPLFANPFVDQYWGLLYLTLFGLILIFHHLLFASSPSP